MQTTEQMLLIEAQHLHELREQQLVEILDVRTGEEFASGHIGGAKHFSVYGINTYDTDEPPLASFVKMWAFQLSLRGLTADQHIIMYDNTTGMCAARAFWFLEYLGHERVSVLNGGLESWTRCGFALERDAVAPKPTKYIYERIHDRVATWRDVLEGIDDPNTIIIDTRRNAEYIGEECDTAECGTVPGAIHLEWLAHLAVDGRLKANDELEALFRSNGITPDKRIIAFCNTGYRSAHAYLALRRLDYPDVRNYVGSWQEWGNRDGCPVVKPTART
jgi:thiosulfate/3-mercaptopyruvate sulfurtransferase